MYKYSVEVGWWRKREEAKTDSKWLGFKAMLTLQVLKWGCANQIGYSSHFHIGPIMAALCRQSCWFFFKSTHIKHQYHHYIVLRNGSLLASLYLTNFHKKIFMIKKQKQKSYLSQDTWAVESFAVTRVTGFEIHDPNILFNVMWKS